MSNIIRIDKDKKIVEKSIPKNNIKLLIKSIVEYGNTIYFLYSPKSIYCLNKTTNNIYKLGIEELRLNGALKDICIAGKDSLYISTGNSLISYVNNKYYSIFPSRTTCVSYDKSTSSIYFGTLSTLYKYDIRSKKTSDLSEIIPELKNKIKEITIDKNNIIWVSTVSNGILAIYNNNIIFTLNKSTGLHNKIVNSINISHNNSIIISTFKGVYIFNYIWLYGKITSGKMQNYTTNNGLSENYIHDACLEDSLLYVATNSSLNIINLKEINKFDNTKLAIIQTSINNRVYSKDSLANLNNNQNYIRISYSSFMFGNKNSLYKYRLLPIQKDWIQTNEHIKEFGPLEPNKYLFEICAIDNNGNNLSDLKSLPFTIHPAFWQTMLFKIAILLAILIIVSIVIYYYLKAKNKEINHQNQLADLKIKALRAQMNPHFIFNCLNTIQGFMNEGNNIDSNRFITKFSHLIRQTLNLSNESFINIDKEVDYLNTYISLEQIRFNHSFDYSINIETTINKNKLFIPSMLLQPLIENSIRHGLRQKIEKGHLDIKFNLLEKVLIVIIDDDGIGFNKNKVKEESNYDSKGLQLISERINTYSVLLKKRDYYEYSG
jgi:hypothetical protein